MPAGKNIELRSWIIGACAFFALAGTVIGSYLHSGGRTYHLAVALTATGSTAFLCAGFYAKRWRALFWSTTAGAIVGIISSIDLLLGPSFENEFIGSVSTLFFFIVLGLLLGAIAEFIRYLHFMAHEIRVGKPH